MRDPDRSPKAWAWLLSLAVFVGAVAAVLLPVLLARVWG